jgi:hypothetical protein
MKIVVISRFEFFFKKTQTSKRLKNALLKLGYDVQTIKNNSTLAPLISKSLGFVGRLHQRLKLAGYDGWFDKVNIPDGDDYAERINHGIESAHNFVYVMAPRCLTSPYCLIELEHARLLGKRIIPINQMAIRTPEQELSDGDKQVLVGFYKFYNQPDQKIHTTQDVVNRSRALIGKTDWLAGQEKVSDDDCQRLVHVGWVGMEWKPTATDYQEKIRLVLDDKEPSQVAKF